MPVLTVGTVYLNPRIMEYDVAPISMAMALVAWRVMRRGRSIKQATILAAVALAAAEVGANHAWIPPSTWRATESVVLTAVFFLGCWDLGRVMRNNEQMQMQMAVAGSGEGRELVGAD